MLSALACDSQYKRQGRRKGQELKGKSLKARSKRARGKWKGAKTREEEVERQ